MGLRLLLTVTLIFNGLIAGGFLGGKLVPPHDGLAGGAVVLWFVVGGALAGLIIGIVLSRRLSRGMVFRACVISSLLAVLFFAIAFLGAKRLADDDLKQQPQKPTTVPVLYLEEVAQPMGLGMAGPRLVAGTTLYIYGYAEPEQMPADLSPTDSITFLKGNGYIDIGMAPPYLVPEILKLDYNVFYFRVVSISRYWIEVIVNKTNGQTAFLDRDAVAYLSWPDFFLNVYAVERLNPEKNPVRARPMDTGSILASGPNVSLSVVSVHGDWLKVSTLGLADRMQPYGYIRWRDGHQLLVRYALFS